MYMCARGPFNSYSRCWRKCKVCEIQLVRVLKWTRHSANKSEQEPNHTNEPKQTTARRKNMEYLTCIHGTRIDRKLSLAARRSGHERLWPSRWFMERLHQNFSSLVWSDKREKCKSYTYYPGSFSERFYNLHVCTLQENCLLWYFKAVFMQS